MASTSPAPDGSIPAADRTGSLRAAVAATDPATRCAETPSCAIFACSLTGTVLAAGAALGELSGGAAQNVVGAPALLLLHPSSHPRLQQVLRAARGGATSGLVTFRLRQRSGPGVEVPGSWSVLTGAGADSSQLVFVASGSSAGHAGRLRVQGAFGRPSREVAFVADAHGNLRYVSPTFGTLFGYDRTAVVPWEVWSYVHADDVARARTVFRAVVQGDAPQTTTLRIRAAAGAWRWVEIEAVDLLDDDAVRGIACAVHDITDEVRDHEGH